jgi:DNA-binding transcriptional regulator YiaG
VPTATVKKIKRRRLDKKRLIKYNSYMEGKYRNRLREIREDMKLKQHELAQLIGVPVPQLSAWEHGKKRIPDGWLIPIRKTCKLKSIRDIYLTPEGREE